MRAPQSFWRFPRKPGRVLLGLCVAIGGLAPAQGEPKKQHLLFGVDVLEARGFDVLHGKQVGLITNQTGVDSRGRRTAQVLAQAQAVKLVALFSPEHGMGGAAQAGRSVSDAIDPRLHLPIYSLYGKTGRPTPEMLNAIDALVFDVQDVGARLYTYLATMGMAMEEAARRGIDFVVLDRPNPLGGTVLEGPIAHPQERPLTCYYAVPIRHGLTAGELAQWYNGTAKLQAKLIVIPMTGWHREDLWPQTGARFIPPSPQIRTPKQALLYAGVGLFEATNLSVGRGTSTPFEVLGAPWIKGRNLVRRLSQLHLAGVEFKPARFVPREEVYAGQVCRGVQFQITDPESLRPVDVFVQIACALRELYPKAFALRWPEVARATGTRDFETLYQSQQPAGAIVQFFHQSAARFAAEREKYLLY